MQKSPSNSCTSHAFGGRPTKRNWIEMHFGEELAWMPWISTLSQSTLIGAGTCQCRAVDIRAVVGKGGFDFSASSVQLRLWLLRFILTSKASNPPGGSSGSPWLKQRRSAWRAPKKTSPWLEGHQSHLEANHQTNCNESKAGEPLWDGKPKRSWLNNDHYITNPNTIVIGKSFKFTIHLHCLIQKKMVQ